MMSSLYKNSMANCASCSGILGYVCVVLEGLDFGGVCCCVQAKHHRRLSQFGHDGADRFA